MWKRIADRTHKCKHAYKYDDVHTSTAVFALHTGGRGVGSSQDFRLMCKRSARCFSLDLDHISCKEEKASPF